VGNPPTGRFSLQVGDRTLHYAKTRLMAIGEAVRVLPRHTSRGSGRHRWGAGRPFCPSDASRARNPRSTRLTPVGLATRRAQAIPIRRSGQSGLLLPASADQFVRKRQERFQKPELDVASPSQGGEEIESHIEVGSDAIVERAIEREAGLTVLAGDDPPLPPEVSRREDSSSLGISGTGKTLALVEVRLVPPARECLLSPLPHCQRTRLRSATPTRLNDKYHDTGVQSLPACRRRGV